jgi:ribosomal protein S12 methylthiotransferase
LAENGYVLSADPRKADVVIINTCGFIQPAKEESIAAVFEALELKKSGRARVVAVTGCLAERYGEEIGTGIPEADVVLPWSHENELVSRLDTALGIHRSGGTVKGVRRLLSPRHWAYLRISEGCDHRCAFCSIPAIRGSHVSVPLEAILAEAERLVADGVQEINVVAQDSTLWGIDLFGKPSLPQLLRRIAETPGLRWIRLLYTHPAHITDELIEVMASSPAIVPYLDMPIQHINDGILKRMRRVVGRKRIEDILQAFRERIPNIILRTALITGLPYETERRFEELLAFVDAVEFDRLGCFVFSCEEGTAAAEMKSKISHRVAQERQALIMETQRSISRRKNRARVGLEYDVLVDAPTPKGGIARSYAEAPEVDGVIRVRSQRKLTAGDWIRVCVTGAGDYDLVADAV